MRFNPGCNCGEGCTVSYAGPDSGTAASLGADWTEQVAGFERTSGAGWSTTNGAIETYDTAMSGDYLVSMETTYSGATAGTPDVDDAFSVIIDWSNSTNYSFVRLTFKIQDPVYPTAGSWFVEVGHVVSGVETVVEEKRHWPTIYGYLNVSVTGGDTIHISAGHTPFATPGNVRWWLKVTGVTLAGTGKVGLISDNVTNKLNFSAFDVYNCAPCHSYDGIASCGWCGADENNMLQTHDVVLDLGAGGWTASSPVECGGGAGNTCGQIAGDFTLSYPGAKWDGTDEIMCRWVYDEEWCDVPPHSPWINDLHVEFKIVGRIGGIDCWAEVDLWWGGNLRYAIYKKTYDTADIPDDLCTAEMTLDLDSEGTSGSHAACSGGGMPATVTMTPTAD